MAGRKKQPVDLVLLNGKKNLTKAEIEERRKQEAQVKGFSDKVEPPSYLTAKQKREFTEIAEELQRLDIFTNLDVDTLAHYIDTRHQYIEVVRSLRKFKPITDKVNYSTGEMYTTTSREYASLQRTKDLLIRQIRSIAGELGLSINARLKLVVPVVEEKKESKFERFGG